MKMFLKRFSAIMLVAAMLFSACSSTVSAYAADESEVIVTENEPVTEEISDSDEAIATISLCTCVYVWPISGHTWIYVHNNSDEPIQVGHYEVPVGQGVSVGAFSFSVNDGWGIYYNIEAYKENNKDRMGNVWSVSEDINADDLAKLTASLKSYPNYWGFVANCATFAFSMWNSVTGDSYFSLLIPAITQIMLIIGGAEKGVLEMYMPPRECVYRLKGFGDEAYLAPASDYTVS